MLIFIEDSPLGNYHASVSFKYEYLYFVRSHVTYHQVMEYAG